MYVLLRQNLLKLKKNKMLVSPLQTSFANHPLKKIKL